MNSLKLYGTGSASANAVANVQMPSRATIRGVQWAVTFGASTTTGDKIRLEVSRASATEMAVNGAQQCISEVCMVVTSATAVGFAWNGQNLFVPVNVAVLQGQLIYLHAALTGTPTYFATALLWWE